MNRIISLSVEDMYIKYTGEAFGATGSHNAVTLRMTFGPAWEGTAKTAYFTDALGNTSVALVLGLDTLVNGAYEVDVPSEALKTAGVATITIKGVLVSGETTTKAITTAAGHFRVLDSELPDSAGSAGTITPSDKDQLQAEIAGMEALFITAKAAAEAAAANAKVSETNAKTSETAAASSASQAQASAAAAAKSAASVDGISKTAQSWAVGGTGTRPGEDTDNAKYWAEQAQAVAGGDFATKVEAQGYVTAHNQSVDAHADIREALNGKAAGKHASQHGANGSDPLTPNAIGAIASTAKGTAGGVASLGTDGKVPASQLPEISSVKTYTATIGTTWVEDENTGVKTQSVAIAGVTAQSTAMVDHVYTGSGTSDDYAAFVEAENQYLNCITNGYAETYDGGIKFTIFGDANTVAIPIVAEVS